MAHLKYESLFKSDLGVSILRHQLFGDSSEDYAEIWAPVLTADGIWGCKILTMENLTSLISVMPGERSLDALLMAISFIYDLEKKRGSAVPHIDFNKKS